MKIIILGAGQVGGTLAEHLAREQNDMHAAGEMSELLASLGELGE